MSTKQTLWKVKLTGGDGRPSIHWAKSEEEAERVKAAALAQGRKVRIIKKETS